MARIDEIKGVDAEQREILGRAGVRTTEELLQKASARTARAHLARETGLAEHTILEWINRADLMELSGVGREYSDLLEEAGVDSSLELSHRRADHLAEALQKVNDEKRLVHRVPAGVDGGEVDRGGEDARPGRTLRRPGRC